MVKRLQNHAPPHRQGGPFFEPRRTWEARAEWDQVKVAGCVNSYMIWVPLQLCLMPMTQSGGLCLFVHGAGIRGRGAEVNLS